MSYHYVTETDASAPYTLPNIWVTQFTSHEVAEGMEDEIREYSRMPQYRLASMNGRDRERMLDAIIADYDVRGGFMWAVCFPGCLPDSDWSGPFPSREEALADARGMLAED